MPGRQTQITEDGVDFIITDSDGNSYEIGFHVPKNGRLDIHSLGTQGFRLCETDSKGRTKEATVDPMQGVLSNKLDIAVTARSVWNSTDTDLTLVGTIDYLVGYQDAQVHFGWGEKGSGYPNSTTTVTADEVDVIKEKISGLTADTEYEFKVVAEKDGKTVTSSHTARTDPVLGVQTHDPSSVGIQSVTLNGYTTGLHKEDSDGNRLDGEVYFEWGAADATLDKLTTSETLSEKDQFSKEITGLTSSTKYEYRAVLESGSETVRGSKVSFSTGDI